MKSNLQALFAGIFCCLLSTDFACGGDIARTPLRLTRGGTAEAPEVFDGKGMVIDLGTDVTGHAWKKEGDVWTSSAPLSGPKPVADGQNAALFLDELPLTLARDRAAERASSDKKTFRYLPPSALRPGQMGCTPDGLLYFRWPSGKAPGTARVILPPKTGTSCVSIECSHIIVRNITAIHASNDGFNIHGDRAGVRLEQVKAFSNCDEGISAHETVQMAVDGAEIAWNGSSDGGVADVNQSVTTYKNCTVHDNVGAAFKFAGKSHRVTDTTIYRQAKDFDVAKGTAFTHERIEHRDK
jgi:hypothetical protein